MSSIGNSSFVFSESRTETAPPESFDCRGVRLPAECVAIGAAVTRSIRSRGSTA